MMNELLEILEDLLTISDPDAPSDVWQALGDKYCGDFPSKQYVLCTIQEKARALLVVARRQR